MVSLLTALEEWEIDYNEIARENDATKTVAECLLHQDVKRFWTAASIWPALEGCHVSRGWRVTKIYDIGWSDESEGPPADVSQVKIGGRTQGSQEAVLFLGDVADGALDWLLSRGKLGVHVAAFLPGGFEEKYWDRLGMEGKVTMTLNPRAAEDRGGQDPSWIDPVSRTIAPWKKSHYYRIFGGGTNAKFVGLFTREGKLSIELSTSVVDCIGTTAIVYSIDSARFDGKSVVDWWP